MNSIMPQVMLCFSRALDDYMLSKQLYYVPRYISSSSLGSEIDNLPRKRTVSYVSGMLVVKALGRT